MLFNSLEYLVFLPAAWIVFWAVPKRKVEALLVASYVFYASWSIPYAAMIFGLVVVNFLFGLALGRATRSRKLMLATFIAFDLCVLALFKYFDFAITSFATGTNALLGLQWDPPLLKLVLPLGISFFTFEFIHYLVDIYRGDLPVHSFSKFHVFAAFFPTQIAGPIKRFQQFVPSLVTLGRFDPALAREGLWLIGRGLGKKVLLADRLAPIATAGFSTASGGAMGTGEAWLTALAFWLQIYFDFSGYTDIARGSAALFGFRIPINFDAPYLATSLTDFWHRWHISLSTWLRDYVYIPLGGSRVPKPVVLRNLMITLLLGGLWHGAAWHFVAWGGLWGIGLSVQHVLRGRIALPRTLPLLVLGWMFTQLFVVASFVLFRAETFQVAGVMLSAMAGRGTEIGLQSIARMLFVGGTAAGLILVSLAGRTTWRPRVPMPTGALRPMLYGASAALVILIASAAISTERQVFIYFQF
ncbi:MAG: MBOAT family protein [Chloroflexi bacterium]|nr:MAG: MBOAT family protein [Chloroflexota bacterium]